MNSKQHDTHNGDAGSRSPTYHNLFGVNLAYGAEVRHRESGMYGRVVIDYGDGRVGVLLADRRILVGSVRLGEDFVLSVF